MKKSYRAQLTKAVNETNDLLKDENLNVRDAYVQVAKLKSIKVSVTNANEKARAFMPAEQVQQECDKIVDYDEKAVVAGWILESTQNEDNLASGATASSVVQAGS